MAVTGHGGSARLIYKAGWQTIVIGGEAEERTTSVPPVLMDGAIRKGAVYANDTIVFFDKLTVIPGVRYEDTSTNNGFARRVSALRTPWEKTPSYGPLLRVGITSPERAIPWPVPLVDSSGTNTWLPNHNLKMETVTSYQAGIESAAMKYCWIKFSLFRNDVRNLAVLQAVATNTVQFVNFGRNRLEGVVIETKTMPIYNTSLLAAAEFLTAKDLDTNETIAGQPVQVYDLGLKYDDGSRSAPGFREGMSTGT